MASPSNGDLKLNPAATFRLNLLLFIEKAWTKGWVELNQTSSPCPDISSFSFSFSFFFLFSFFQ